MFSILISTEHEFTINTQIVTLKIIFIFDRFTQLYNDAKQTTNLVTNLQQMMSHGVSKMVANRVLNFVVFGF